MSAFFILMRQKQNGSHNILLHVATHRSRVCYTSAWTSNRLWAKGYEKWRENVISCIHTEQLDHYHSVSSYPSIGVNMDSDSTTSDEAPEVAVEVTTPVQFRIRIQTNYDRLSVKQKIRRLREVERKAKKSRKKIFADVTDYENGDVYEESDNLGAERQLAEWEGHMADEIPVDPIPLCDPTEEEDNSPFGIQPAVQGAGIIKYIMFRQ
jgi:hypothetical protein